MKLKHLFVAGLLVSSMSAVTLPDTSKANTTYNQTTYSKPIIVNLESIKSTSYTFTLSTPYILKEQNLILNKGEYQVSLNGSTVELFNGSTKLFSAASLTIFPLDYTLSSTATFKNLNIGGSRTYLGTLTFAPSGSQVSVQNELFLEHYLYGVVPYEMSNSWELEALKAQAVAARTYATGKANNTIVDTVSDQVYKGYNASYTRAIQAVNETQGVELHHNGKSIGSNAMYSSTNGGYKKSKTNVYGSNFDTPAYLMYRFDQYDFNHTYHKNWNFTLEKYQINLNNLDLYNPSKWWETTVEKGDSKIIDGIKKAIAENTTVPAGHEIKVVYIKNLHFTNPKSNAIFSNTALMGTLSVEYYIYNPADPNNFEKNGNGFLKLQTFTLQDRTYNFYLKKYFGTDTSGLSMLRSPNVMSVSEYNSTYTVIGNGFGHGIGMSQYGAKQAAIQGKKYNEILLHYYMGVTLTPKTNVAAVIKDANSVVTETPDQLVKKDVIKTRKYTGVYKESKLGSSISGYLFTNQQYEVVGSENDFWKISLGDGFGYVYKNDVSYEEVEVADTKTSNTATVSLNKDLTVYANSNYTAPIAVINKGNKVPVIKQEGSKLTLNFNGQIGYAAYVDSTVSTSTNTTVTSSTSNTYHVVKSGDTLYKISTTYKVSVDSIKSLNNLNSNSISVGQKLLVIKSSTVVTNTTSNTATTATPSTKVYHVVKSGDTLYKISTTYKVSVDSIKSLNNLKSNTISVGQNLLVK